MLRRTPSPSYAVRFRCSEIGNLHSPSDVVNTGKNQSGAPTSSGGCSAWRGQAPRAVVIEFGLLHIGRLIAYKDVDVSPNIDCIHGYLRVSQFLGGHKHSFDVSILGREASLSRCRHRFNRPKARAKTTTARLEALALFLETCLF